MTIIISYFHHYYHYTTTTVMSQIRITIIDVSPSIFQLREKRKTYHIHVHDKRILCVLYYE